MEIVLETVEIAAATRGTVGSKYDGFVIALASAPVGKGMSRVTLAELTGIRSAIKRHNDANPDKEIFIVSRAVEKGEDGAGTVFAFAKTASRHGKKRGRKARVTDDAPKAGETYNE